MGGRQAGDVRKGIVLAVVMTLVGALVATGGLLVVTGVVKVGGGGGASASGATPTARSTGPSARPTPTRDPAGPVLRSLDGAPLPTQAGLARMLGTALGASALRRHTSVAIRDVATGKLLYAKDGGGAYIPASTTKILTATAVLAALGPDHRFETRVVAGSRPGQVVLVGGGDPLLATGPVGTQMAKSPTYPTPATLDDLAARTARALRASGRTSVQVGFDDSLFTQAVSPYWESQYVPTGVVGPVSALWVDEARLNWPAQVPRPNDPAKTTADLFVDALGRNGVAVKGSPARTKAGPKARRLASVASPPLGNIVEQVLLISDNDGAEVLARHVAVAEHRPATFAGAAAATRRVLARLGVTDARQIALHDGSGLSRHGRLSADVLTQTLAVAARPEFPDLRPVLTGLPVAGYSGSLQRRFYDDLSEPGVGIVRAKTGSLSGVSSLAGVATTQDGAVLAFAFMTDKAREGDPRPSIDQAASALARCGCR